MPHILSHLFTSSTFTARRMTGPVGRQLVATLPVHSFTATALTRHLSTHKSPQQPPPADNQPKATQPHTHPVATMCSLHPDFGPVTGLFTPEQRTALYRQNLSQHLDLFYTLNPAAAHHTPAGYTPDKWAEFKAKYILSGSSAPYDLTIGELLQQAAHRYHVYHPSDAQQSNDQQTDTAAPNDASLSEQLKHEMEQRMESIDGDGVPGQEGSADLISTKRQRHRKMKKHKLKKRRKRERHMSRRNTTK